MPSSPTATELAATIRAEMARRAVPQTLVAERLGLSQTAMSRRLRAKVEFTVSELVTIADVLDVDPASLLRAS